MRRAVVARAAAPAALAKIRSSLHPDSARVGQTVAGKCLRRDGCGGLSQFLPLDSPLAVK